MNFLLETHKQNVGVRHNHSHSMYKAELHRLLSDPFQTLGSLTFYDGEKILLTLSTLELPWRNNERRVSCIPEGIYKVVKRYSQKYRDHWHVLNVPDRDWILIHIGNFHHQIEGCILPGLSHQDIDGDGLPDVVSSGEAMRRINDLMGDHNEFELKIFS